MNLQKIGTTSYFNEVAILLYCEIKKVYFIKKANNELIQVSY